MAVSNSPLVPLLFQAVYRFVTTVGPYHHTPTDEFIVKDFVTSVMDTKMSSAALLAVRLLCVLVTNPECALVLLGHRLEKLLTVLLCCIIRRVLAVQQTVTAKAMSSRRSSQMPMAPEESFKEHHGSDGPELSSPTLAQQTSTPVISGPRRTPLSLKHQAMSPVHPPEGASPLDSFQQTPRRRNSSARSLSFDSQDFPTHRHPLSQSFSRSHSSSEVPVPLVEEEPVFDLPTGQTFACSFFFSILHATAISQGAEPGRPPRTPLARLRRDMMAPVGLAAGEDVAVSHPVSIVSYSNSFLNSH